MPLQNKNRIIRNVPERNSPTSPLKNGTDEWSMTLKKAYSPIPWLLEKSGKRCTGKELYMLHEWFGVICLRIIQGRRVLLEVDFGEKLLYTKACSLIFKKCINQYTDSLKQKIQQVVLQKTQTTLIMKKFKFCILADYLSCCQCPPFAEGRLPLQNIQTAFQKLYPTTDVEWSKQLLLAESLQMVEIDV